mgnify:CR=1 FL=1
MAYRVYDNEQKKWLKDNIYLTPDGELFLIKKSLFGMIKSLILSQDRYIYHKTIDLLDKNKKQVHEGDYIKAQVSEDRSVIGLVAFAVELSAWVILCVDSDEFFTLGSETTEFIEIIGNVFDGYKEEKKDGKPTL